MSLDELKMYSGGSEIHLTFKENKVVFPIDGATIKKIIFQKADGTIIVKDATYDTDGTDGKMYYEFTSDDLNVAGDWSAQGFVRMSSTEQHYSSIVKFKVSANLTIVE